MSIYKELNSAKQAMGEAKTAEKTGDFGKAAALYNKAANHYGAGGRQDNKHIALLNQGSALVSANDEAAAIVIFQQLETDGFTDPALARNLYAAHYNLGLKKVATDVSAAIASFTAAKIYNSTVDTCYRLADVLLKNGKFANAETEFAALLSKAPAPAEFSLALKLNTYCLLMRSQTEQGKAVDEATLLAAKDAFNAMASADKVAHKDEADYIIQRLAAKYFSEGKSADAKKVLKEEEDAIAGTEKPNLEALEKLALHTHKNGDSKGAVHFLLNIAEAFYSSTEPALSGIAAHAIGQAEAIVTNYNKPNASDVSQHIFDNAFTDLKAIGALHAEIDAYFV